MAGRALVTGATGFIGGRLTAALTQAGWDVRAMVRDRAGSRARELERDGLELHEGDVLRPESLHGAGQGVDVAYYLIHSMGRCGRGDFVASERAAATSFAQMAKAEGVGRVVYLGGLGDRPQSKHLRSRHETALALAEHGPPLTYFRAGMVVGAAERVLPDAALPGAETARHDRPGVVEERQAADRDRRHAGLSRAGACGRGVDRQGGPDRRPGSLELRRDARSHGRGARPAPAPAGAGPADHAVAVLAVDRPCHSGRRGRRQAVGGRARRTHGRHRPGRMELFDVQPIGFDEALRRAVAEDPDVKPASQPTS
jgi:uncharacterized protein YbjT (DUF2867 family)